MQIPFEKIVVAVFPGFDPVPQPRKGDLEDFERRHKFKLPHSYAEFVLRLGPGELGGFRITAPGNSGDDSVELAAHNKTIHEGEEGLVFQHKQAKLIRRMFFFGSIYGGDFLAWDPGKITDPEAHEYQILGVPRVEKGIVKLADSFAELVQRILDRTVADPVGRIQLGTKKERSQFNRFVVGAPGEEPQPLPAGEQVPKKLKKAAGGGGVAKWTKLNSPLLMLAELRKVADQRKLRLFAIACCRYIFELLDDARSKKAVEVAEQFADGLASEQELASAWERAKLVADERERTHRQDMTSAEKQFSTDAAMAAAHVATADARDAATIATTNAEDAAERSGKASRTAIRQYQCDLLRDICGPIKPADIEPEWNSPGVRSLAAEIYEKREFERMPELGRALKEAGCKSSFVLSHCGPDEVHARGCWLLDSILGK